MPRVSHAAAASASPLKRAARPLFYALAFFYLGFHAFSGERGALALFRESRKLEILSVDLAQAVAERKALDAKIVGLGSDSLDLDLLDEQARRILGTAGKNEVVYFLEE